MNYGNERKRKQRLYDLQELLGEGKSLSKAAKLMGVTYTTAKQLNEALKAEAF